jgi:hypothetical protein
MSDYLASRHHIKLYSGILSLFIDNYRVHSRKGIFLNRHVLNLRELLILDLWNRNKSQILFII